MQKFVDAESDPDLGSGTFIDPEPGIRDGKIRMRDPQLWRKVHENLYSTGAYYHEKQKRIGNNSPCGITRIIVLAPEPLFYSVLHVKIGKTPREIKY